MAKNAIQLKVAVGIGEKVNILQGTRFENVYKTGLLLVAVTSDQADMECELFVADRNAIERSGVSDTAKMPILPDDIIVDDVECFVGEKMQLNVYGGAAAGNAYCRLILDDNVAQIG